VCVCNCVLSLIVFAASPLLLADNPCSDNIDGCGNSHRLLTIALHRKLRVLDGVEINEEERTRAAAFVASLPEEAQEQIRSLYAWTPPTQDDDSVLEVQTTFNRNFAMLYETARKSR
jgi:hypothetical protein